MTSHERVTAALRHEEVDRTPIFEYVLLPPIADAVLGREYLCGERFRAFALDRGLEAAVRREAADRLDIAERLGHDMLYVTPNPTSASLRPRPAAPGPPEDPDDPVGTIRASVKVREAAAPTASDEALLVYRALREEMDRRGVRYPILAPAYGHGVWTNTALMQTMVLDPDLARRHFACSTRDCAAAARRYAAAGVELIGVGGDFAGNRGPLVSPACYRDLIAPELRKLSDEVHALGCHAVNASDGDLWPVIEDFLLTAGVDGYIEIDERAGMDLGRLKARFGDRITFFGNLDCGTLLSFGTPEEIRRAVEKCLRDGWGAGGHVLCASNAVTATVPPANYRAIGEAHRAFFSL